MFLNGATGSSIQNEIEYSVKKKLVYHHAQLLKSCELFCKQSKNCFLFN